MFGAAVEGGEGMNRGPCRMGGPKRGTGPCDL